MKLGYKILLYSVQLLIGYIIYDNYWNTISNDGIPPELLIIGLMYSTLLIIVMKDK